MNINQQLINCALPWAKDRTIKEIRFGLGYSCVELDNGQMGVAWTPERRDAGSCTHVEKAGGIAGSEASEILKWLISDQSLKRAAGLAAFNALNAKIERQTSDNEAISLLKIQPNEHVVMVGYFAPVIPTIKATNCHFEVVELNSDKPGVISPEQGFEALSQCDVAIITSTSIINGTCNRLLQSLQRNRAALMLGPSTPMCPEAFAGARITQLSGSCVIDNEMVKTIISEGGGTRLLKKHLRFASVMAKI
jgi:uncharacterized protein (DUF4213/DUF364 family)